MNIKINKTLILISFLIVFLLSFIVGGIYLISTYNGQAVTLNRYEMKVKDNQSEFDNMWKKISQSTQIADSKKQAFKEIFSAYAQARTPQDSGKMMLWIKENAPNIDIQIYDKTLNIINGSRDSWTFRQKELVGIAEEYNKNLVQFPNNFILKFMGFSKLDPKVITSTRTQNAFESGIDDNTSLK
jgi:hypothetical protein